jgi:hypothetical protein
MTKEINVNKIKTCFKLLSLGFTFAMFYALFVVASPWMNIGVPLEVLNVYWAIVKFILAFGLICYYNGVKQPKIAFAGIFMLTSSVFTIFPINGFLSLAVEALALTSLSLTIFDLNKLFPGLRLSVAAGLIFLGVIFSILNNPMMLSISGFAWLFGFLVASNRVGILSKLREAN